MPDRLRLLIGRLPEPAYLTGQRWDMLAWNEATAALFGDWGRLAPAERNILLWMLTNPAARRLFADGWAAEARRMVALFRAAHDLWPGDPSFAAWWAAHGVGAPVSGTKELHHPVRGVLRYDYTSVQANDDPALKLALYTRR